MVKIGDIFEIPLRNGSRTYAQYVYKDNKQGPLIQVFDLVTRDNLEDLDKIIEATPLFPPVITGVYAAIRVDMWHVIGNRPVNGFVYPKFVSSYYNEKSGIAYKWFLWDGNQYSFIGDRLPNEFKNLEYLVVWSPYDIVDRILTGKYPFPYGDLIKYNKFTPIKMDSR
jgi:hypothetical protein